MKDFSKIFFSFLVLIILASTGYAQTALNFTFLSGDLRSEGRGAEYWNGVSWDGSSVPFIPAGNSSSLNAYYRFNWTDFENVTQGSYDWTKFDQQINNAIDNGRAFSFGIMPMCIGCSMPSGNVTLYPRYLHTIMQGEATKDWVNSDGIWVPNWNSNNYLSGVENLLNAIAAHIASGTHSGKNYKDVIFYVDIRLYGNYGEWHECCWKGSGPAGTLVTSASLKRIIDAYRTAFPNYPLMALIAGFDNGNPSSTGIPTDVGYYLLTATNGYGRFGWRRDNYGDAGYDSKLINNPYSYNPGTGSVAFAPLIMNAYQFAPVTGEPTADGSAATRTCGTYYCDLLREIQIYHGASFGNGNYPVSATANPPMTTNLQSASAASGYQITATGGSMTTQLLSGGAFNISINWRNMGLAPAYYNWRTVFELRNSSGTVVWSGTSGKAMKLFLPSGSSTTQSDNFTLGSVAAGTYNMFVIIRDPTGYRAPMALAITGRDAGGGYLIRSGIQVAAGGNQPPTAGITGAGSITLPVNSVALSGTVSSDPDGTISLYQWNFVSGPNLPTIGTPTASTSTISGMTAGTYVIQLTVTDNLGATGSTTKTIIVNNTNIAPVATITGTGSIILPTNSVTLSGTSSSDADGSITAYLWSQFSGPNIATKGTPTASSCIMSNLIAGTYVFQLQVTDNNAATNTSQFTVNVNNSNTPPVAAITGNGNVQLPTNSVALSGTGSTDADGSITAYAWTQVSGPNTASESTPTSSTCTMGGLIAGTYVFKLQVTDNGGAIGSTTKTVIVGNTNVPPTAAITVTSGTNNITLPTSSIPLSGATSTDPDGTISSYAWSFISGPNTPTIGTPTASTSTVSGLVQGSYVIQLQVTDNNGATGSTTITVNVSPSNASPFAFIGFTSGAATITLPTSTVTFNSTGSNDPDGSIVSYLWTLVSGPSGSAFGTPTASSTTVTGLVQGLYTFQLQVIDNGGAAGSKIQTVLVNPVPGGNSIHVFSTQVPALPTFNDGQPLELGMKFRATTNGFITGARFYKTAGNVGTHTGQLYSSTGTLLASATFTAETATGWQSVTFSSPVAITAGLTYVVAYFSSAGNYADDDGMFNVSINNGPLIGLADGTDGPNGVYKYTAVPAFPTSSYQKSNYWIDVNFTQITPCAVPDCIPHIPYGKAQ